MVPECGSPGATPFRLSLNPLKALGGKKKQKSSKTRFFILFHSFSLFVLLKFFALSKIAGAALRRGWRRTHGHCQRNRPTEFPLRGISSVTLTNLSPHVNEMHSQCSEVRTTFQMEMATCSSLPRKNLSKELSAENVASSRFFCPSVKLLLMKRRRLLLILVTSSV